MHSLTSETPPVRGSRYTEEDWNNDSTIENGQFYPLSKVWRIHVHCLYSLWLAWAMCGLLVTGLTEIGLFSSAIDITLASCPARP